MPAETPEGPNLWTQEDLDMLSESDLREMVQAEHLPLPPVPGEGMKQALIDALLAHQRQTGEG
jgi:hypothetical protein